MWYVKKENTPLSITGSLVASTDEVSVILITEPLLSGRYMGKRLPENCVFPEILNFLETATTYRMIAGKTTMLTKEAADEIVDVYNVDEKKKIRMVSQVDLLELRIALIFFRVVHHYKGMKRNSSFFRKKSNWNLGVQIMLKYANILILLENAFKHFLAFA